MSTAEQAGCSLPGVGELPLLEDAFDGYLLVCPERPPETRPEDWLAGDSVRLKWPVTVDGVLQLCQHDTRTPRDDLWRVADRLFRQMRQGSRRPVWAWRRENPSA